MLGHLNVKFYCTLMEGTGFLYEHYPIRKILKVTLIKLQFIRTLNIEQLLHWNVIFQHKAKRV